MAVEEGSGPIKPLSRADMTVVLCGCFANLATSYSVAIAFPTVPLYSNEKGISDVTAVRFCWRTIRHLAHNVVLFCTLLLRKYSRLHAAAQSVICLCLSLRVEDSIRFQRCLPIFIVPPAYVDFCQASFKPSMHAPEIEWFHGRILITATCRVLP